MTVPTISFSTFYANPFSQDDRLQSQDVPAAAWVKHDLQ